MQKLLSYLACPICGGTLKQGERLECLSGCGSYPVESGVPRLLPELCRKEEAAEEYQDGTRRSFGTQWKMFQYGGTTWGIRVEERVPVVLHELNWSESDLSGKVILDAGCGNGTLSAALAGRGATVLALDLSDSVFRAKEHCSTPGVHFIQGNLFFPPLKRGIFDAIYSCGVFHHTPDTKRCFDALVPTLKNSVEAKYFIWLYSQRSRLFNATVQQAMKVTRRMPSSLLVPLCFTLSPLVEGASRLLTALRVVEYAPRTLRDRAIQLHDLLSPAFVHYHSFEEAAKWARSAGFKEVRRTSYEAAGRQGEILQKYRRVCRPGFGMLCYGRNGPRSGS
ncbi:MAG: methyltransferase domain-containing protein [Nitrospiraceae bacterium]